jgi:hypothetical protein
MVDEEKEKAKAYSRAHYLRNKEKIQAAAKKRYATDPEYRERILKNSKNRALAKSDEVARAVKRWQRENPVRLYQYSATRYAKKRKALIELTPAELLRVKEIYRLANHLNQTGIRKYEVDHIVPVSRGGIHHPNNLVILEKGLNRSKGSNHWPWLGWFIRGN